MPKAAKPKKLRQVPKSKGNSRRNKRLRQVRMMSKQQVLSQGMGGVGMHNTSSSFDLSGNSLRSPQIPARIPDMVGGGESMLGIEASSGNWYLDNLVDPSRAPVRMPDLYSKRTSVHKTILYGTLTPNVTSSVHFGSTANVFGIVLNPFLGYTSSGAINSATITTCVGNGTTATVNSFYNDEDVDTLNNLISEIRPVSAFVYVSFVGDTLTDGGQISAAFLPSGSVGNGSPYPISTVGGIEYFNIANTSILPGAYTGPVRKGCYIRWQPEDERDSFFYTTGAGSAAEAYNFPKLVITGTSTSNSPNIRWFVHVNYEFTTTSRLFAQMPSPIETRLIEHAKKCLQVAPYAVANDEHQSIWQRFLNWARGAVESVKGFYNDDIKPWLGPALGIGGRIADVIGLPEIGVPLTEAGQFISSH